MCLRDSLSFEEPTVEALSWGLAAVAAQLEALGRQADEDAAGRRRRLLKDQLVGSGGLRRAAGLLRDMQITPLTTLRAPDNTYATAPLRVDALAAEAWDPIFNPAEGGRPLEKDRGLLRPRPGWHCSRQGVPAA